VVNVVRVAAPALVVRTVPAPQLAKSLSQRLVIRQLLYEGPMGSVGHRASAHAFSSFTHQSAQVTGLSAPDDAAPGS
jgi:hypothetical protein